MITFFLAYIAAKLALGTALPDLKNSVTGKKLVNHYGGGGGPLWTTKKTLFLLLFLSIKKYWAESHETQENDKTKFIVMLSTIDQTKMIMINL